MPSTCPIIHMPQRQRRSSGLGDGSVKPPTDAYVGSNPVPEIILPLKDGGTQQPRPPGPGDESWCRARTRVRPRGTGSPLQPHPPASLEHAVNAEQLRCGADQRQLCRGEPELPVKVSAPVDGDGKILAS